MDFPTPFSLEGIEAPRIVAKCPLPLVVNRAIQLSQWTSIEHATAGNVPAIEDLRLSEACLCHRASALHL